ncbi:hypothetical protein HYP07_gp076 [Vibrio phage JSF3]|uniref:hypothetical protein n=1 Tax=Vibrio phage JSF3 TaxID=1916111 RepID=UPI000B61DAFF|nr:hypothetical protein HYP07_gp076 [Vibrio phage JSF3]APD18088.1 hypothetical protein [Vibrio phage JSF3]
MERDDKLMDAIDVLVQSFIDSGAPNFQGHRVQDTETGQQYTIVVHKLGGLIPDQSKFE